MPPTGAYPAIEVAARVHPPTRPRRVRVPKRLVLSGLLVLAGIGAGGVFVALSLAHSAPAWWSPTDRRDAEALAVARTLENGIATLLTKVRSGAPVAARAGKPEPAEAETWTVALKATDANAWLATRLRVWVENDSGAPVRWPEAVTGVQVRFEDGVISVGAAVDRGGSGGERSDEARFQVLTASLVPEFRTDGSFWLPARWVSVGRLSLPAAWMLSSAPGAARDLPANLEELPQTRDLLAAFAGALPVMQTPIIKIGDGRRVRLVGLEARDGRLLITCQTLGRETSRAGR